LSSFNDIGSALQKSGRYGIYNDRTGKALGFFASMIVLGVQFTADEAGSTRERIPQRDASVPDAHVPAGSNLLVARLHSRTSARRGRSGCRLMRAAHAATTRLAALIKFAFATVSVTT
jgi:hypothetical protein